MKFKDYPKSMKFLMCVFIAVWLVLSYWIFYPYKPIVIQEPLAIHNENKTIEAGKFLTYELDMDKRMNLGCVINRQLVNDFSILYSPSTSHMQVGKKKVKVKIKVPHYAEPGEYRLMISLDYQVNPIRIVNVTKWSEPFNITKEGS